MPKTVNKASSLETITINDVLRLHMRKIGDEHAEYIDDFNDERVAREAVPNAPNGPRLVAGVRRDIWGNFPPAAPSGRASVGELAALSARIERLEAVVFPSGTTRAGRE